MLGIGFVIGSEFKVLVTVEFLMLQQWLLFALVQIPIILQKDGEVDERGNPLFEPDGKPRLRCGFKIGGGIDQDHTRCPHGYPDNVR